MLAFAVTVTVLRELERLTAVRVRTTERPGMTLNMLTIEHELVSVKLHGSMALTSEDEICRRSVNKLHSDGFLVLQQTGMQIRLHGFRFVVRE